MVSNGKISKNFDEITNKIQHRPFLENFEKIVKFLKIWPPTPQIHFLLHLQETNLGWLCCSMGQKSRFCVVETPHKGRSPQEYLT